MYKCSLYYNKKLDEYKSNAKSTWKLLNDLINKKKIKCKLPSIFKSNEEEIWKIYVSIQIWLTSL